MSDTKKILVGKIVAFQGVRGDVRVQTFTQKPDDFKNLVVFGNKITPADFKFVRTVPDVKPGEYYQADLIGFTVIQNGEKVGIISGFQNFGAGDIIETSVGNLYSFKGAEVDLNNKTVTVK